MKYVSVILEGGAILLKLRNALSQRIRVVYDLNGGVITLHVTNGPSRPLSVIRLGYDLPLMRDGVPMEGWVPVRGSDGKPITLDGGRYAAFDLQVRDYFYWWVAHWGQGDQDSKRIALGYLPAVLWVMDSTGRKHYVLSGRKGRMERQRIRELGREMGA